MRLFAPSRFLPGVLVPIALALALAGCGSMDYPAQAAGGGLSISASALSVATNGEIALHASPASGQAAPVQWKIVSGTNSPALGQGHIDPTGVYRAPGSLSADSIAVRIEARLQSNPATWGALTLIVHPGFVQPLLPQNIALTPGASAEVTAQIAEVDAGNVSWSLGASQAGGEPANGTLGTLSNSACRRASDRYTTCTVTYTAPTVVPGQQLYLVASVNGTRISAPLRVLVNNRGIVSNPVTNQAVQPGFAALGASGGNDGDYDTWEDAKGNSFVADCCGGTLGALVQDEQKNQYILSNNHVLAESDQARIGDTIDQPGLIDGACTPLNRPGSPLHPVGSLKYFVPLQSTQTNVDAALASVVPGTIDPSGAILQLGTPGQDAALAAAPPMAGSGEPLSAANLGMDVAKSGRTTGLTCSSIEAVALTVKVDYYKDCAETQPWTTKIFSNQIGIGGVHFTDSGDSGSLVVDASNSEAVGLYFAGGTDGDGHGLSIANPIGDVLNELGNETGSKLSIVGTSTAHPVACMRYDPAVPTVPPKISAALLDKAQALSESAAASLRGPGVLGTAPGASLDSEGQPAIVVYVEHAGVKVPQTIDGLRTEVIVTDAGAVARGTVPQVPLLQPGLHLTAAELAHATDVERRAAPQLMDDPAIFGVGVTQSRDNPAEAALLVLVDIGRNPQSMPATIGGLRVRYLHLHRFHTTRARDTEPHRTNACSLKGLRPLPQN
jgi:hypothetical protein